MAGGGVASVLGAACADRRAVDLMSEPVLVLNAGSSTLKASIVAPSPPGASPAAPIATTTIGLGDDASAAPDHAAAVDRVLAELRGQGGDPAMAAAVAHRVVHGSTSFRHPTVVDDRVLEGI